MSTNYVQKATGASPTGLTDSLLYDNGTGVGIGTTSPAYSLHISGTGDKALVVETTSNTRSAAIGTNQGGNNAFVQLSQDAGDSAKTWQLLCDTSYRFNIGHPGESARVSVSAAGDVGIGNDSPDARLHVETSGTSQLALHVVSGDDGVIRFDGGDNLHLEVLGSDSTLLMGDYSGQSDPRIDFYSGGGGSGNLDNRLVSVGATYSGMGQGVMRFLSRIVEIRTTDLEQTRRSLRFRIDDGGDEGEDNSAMISLNAADGTIEFAVDNSVIEPGDHVRMKVSTETFDPSSAVYTASDGKTLTTVSPSSTRYKQNIRDHVLEPERIFALRLKTFEWKSTNQQDIGFLAEDVKEVLPELYREGELVTGWKADRFHFYLFEAVKQLRNRVEGLSALVQSRQSGFGID